MQLRTCEALTLVLSPLPRGEAKNQLLTASACEFIWSMDL